MGTVCIRPKKSLEFDEEDYGYGQLVSFEWLSDFYCIDEAMRHVGWAWISNKNIRNRNSHLNELPATSDCPGVYRKTDGHYSKSNDVSQLTATESTLQQFPELAARYKHVVCGDFNTNLSLKAKIVRIFISSTFTDTAVERNELMVKVFPALKTFCQDKGYEFQVVDMRWGVREQSADDHTTLDLCLKEIQACQQISTGPNFVTFLGQKYGFRPFPPKIPKAEFEMLFSSITNVSDQALLQRWFQCDYNVVPPKYLLQPISSFIPGYLSSDVNERTKAYSEWQDVFKRLQTVLRQAAVISLQDKEEIHKYFMSVTESEIRSGVLSSSNPSSQCCWFNRKIENLQDHVTDERAKYYIDVQEEGVLNEEAQKLLDALKNDIVLQHLSDNNIRHYQVEWRSQGIDPEHCESHKVYIERMRYDVRAVLEELIKSAILSRMSDELNDSVYDEASQHLLFCKSKCETFFGREDVLNQCCNYLIELPNPQGSYLNNNHANGRVKDTDDVNHSSHKEQNVQIHKNLTKEMSSSLNEHKSNRPLVIFGESGCGKTSVVSMVAMKAREWLGENLKVIVRYVGTTPESSQVRLLLRSVCRQICVVYDEDSSFVRNDIKNLQKDFLKCLQMATVKEPLLIVLDSLDQFGPEDSARQLSWLPMILPDYVKLVVSTIPGEEYECLPVLEAFLSKECFVEVLKLPQDDAAKILVNWLSMANRTLSKDQQVIVKQALQRCSLPIFVRVTFDEAIRWKSYSPPDKTRLEHTVRGAINALFSRIEKQHGQVLVRHALGYVTAAKSGLTETELEDVLSCDDEVLDDVYQFWTPPIRRIPPLLWVRVRADLSGYLVDRGADGARVITWYHRQFIEAARARYLSDEVETLKIHRALSEYFLGQWSNGILKPYSTREGTEKAADRIVARQPLTFQSSSSKMAFNYRKLNELPHHLTCARMLETLKREVLCHFEFLLVNLLSSTLRDVLDDYDFALQSWPDDDDMRLVKETLQLSTFALAEYPHQLSCQLLGRMKSKNSPFLQDLLQQARTSPHSNLIPSAVCLTSPGGPMVHSLSGQSQPSTALSVSDDGKLVVSASGDNSCSIWEVASGRLVRTLENAGDKISSLVFSADKSVVVASSPGCVSAWRISTGQRLFLIEGSDTLMPVCFIEFNGESALATIIGTSIKLYSLKTRKQIQEFIDVKLDGSLSQDNVSLFSLQTSLYYMVGNGSEGAGSSVRVLDVSRGDMKCVLTFHEDVSLVGVSAYGTLLILQGVPIDSRSNKPNQKSGVFQLWDYTLNKRLRCLNDSDENMRCYGMSCDKRNVVTLNDVQFLSSANVFQGRVKIFSLNSEDIKECTLRFPSSIHLIRYVDYNSFISSSIDKLVRVWDLSRNQDSHDTQDGELEIVESKVNKVVFVQQSNVGFIDVRSGCKVLFTNGHAPQLDFLNETKAVITNGEDIFLFDLTESKMNVKFQGKTRSDCSRSFFILDQSQVIAISLDSKSLNIYDVSSGKEIAQLKSGKGNLITRFASTSDGRFCVIAFRESSKGELAYGYSVWDVEKRTQVTYLRGIQQALPEFADLTISNNGSYVLDIVFDTISGHYHAVVYDVTSGRLLHEPEDNVHCASFVTGGKQILLGTTDGNLRLYDSVSGQCIHSMRAHSGAIHRIFTNDYTDVVMTTVGGLDSKDRSLRIWRIKDDKIAIHAVFTPDAKISSMSFVTKGQAIVLEITDIVPFWLITDDSDRKLMQHSEKSSLTVDLADFSVLSV